MKIGTVTGPLLNGIAGQLESIGYATVLFTDNQAAAPEVWTALGFAASETTTAKIGPGVTNTLTRDVSVTADAALTLQALSGGRCVLAVGRGDASAHYIGERPEPLRQFEAKIAMLKRYLAGEVVQRDTVKGRVEWLAHLPDLAKVPLELVPSGPRMAELAARFADRISFAIGADPEYIRDFMNQTRLHAETHGRDSSEIQFGAWINAVAHDNKEVARDCVRGTAALWARFAAFRGQDLRKLPGPLSRTAQYLRDHYEMDSHGDGAAVHAQNLSDEFLDWFAITGSTENVSKRFQDLASIGLDYCYVIPGTLGFADAVGAESIARIASDIIPIVDDQVRLGGESFHKGRL